MLALVLNTKSYNFTDKKTGQNVTGSNVTFVTKQDINGELTYIVSKQSSPDMSAMGSLFPTVPGLYDIEFELLPSTGSRLNTKISKSEFLTKINEDLGGFLNDSI